MPLTPYERKILLVFASSFPASAQYRDGRKLRKGKWELLFPEIERDPASKENFLAAAEALVERGVVSAKWRRYRKGDALDALFLEDSAKLYALLGEKHPDEERRAMIAILDAASDRDKNQWEARVREYCRNLLAEKRFPEELKTAELADILRLLALSPVEASAYSIRGMSIRMFNRSKRIEELLDACDSLAARATGEKLSERLGLARVYPETTIAGNIALRFEGGEEWGLAGRIVTLP